MQEQEMELDPGLHAIYDHIFVYDNNSTIILIVYLVTGFKEKVSSNINGLMESLCSLWYSKTFRNDLIREQLHDDTSR